MGRIVRYEFLGSQMLFFVLCLTGVGLPIAVLYLLRNLVLIEEKLENPSELMEQFRSRAR
ncbi:MAG: hypothetical protein GWP08_04595 [Nitrospiraceae bacterium]|nr:hypothetical protein [Nitrospiraceae bacterium]